MSRGAANADFQGAKTGFQGAKSTRKVVSALGKWFQHSESDVASLGEIGVPAVSRPLSAPLGPSRPFSALLGPSRPHSANHRSNRSRSGTPHLVAAAQRRSGYLFSSSITARFWKKK